jgi:MoaA/NifB/PqqE/SkfB family radical SAM enzyme
MVTPFNSPKYIYAFLTENCNLSCTHCYGDFSSTEEITINEWKKIFSSLIKSEIFYFILSGGEPTVHRDFPKILEYLVSKGQYFTIITNGIWSAEIEKNIIKNEENIIHLKISLDGFNFETYNYLRNIKSELIFDQLINRIKRLEDLGFKIVLGINIHSKTINRLEEFCEFINDLNPTGIQISTITNAGRAKTLLTIDKEFSLEQISVIKQVFLKKINTSIVVDFVDMPFETKEKFGYSCPAMDEFWAVRSNGDLIPCPLFNEPQLKKSIPFPNLIHQTLERALNSKELIALKESKKVACKYNNISCVNIEYCDRCIAQSIINGDLSKPPTFCMQYEKEIFK